jgi:hypothetical protein
MSSRSVCRANGLRAFADYIGLAEAGAQPARPKPSLNDLNRMRRAADYILSMGNERPVLESLCDGERLYHPVI